MVGGLYRVTFQTLLGSGAGVVFLRDGIIHGGDSMMFYVGNYTSQGEVIRAELRTGAHTKVLGMGSVFGRDVVNLVVEGRWVGPNLGQNAQLNGMAKEERRTSFSASLSRLST